MKLTIPPLSDSVAYTGRWHITADRAAATACGSSLRIGFSGAYALLTFDVSHCRPPFPHLYLSLDGGARIETAVSDRIRVRATDSGTHELTVLLKSSSEAQERWTDPVACVKFTGCIDTPPAPLAPDTRPVLEIIGDSITEGTSVSPELALYTGERWQENLVYTNDVCASYSYQTAALLNCRPVFMGYGMLGTTAVGGGNIPCVPDSYPYVQNGVPYDGHADFIIINHGTNDQRTDSPTFRIAYRRLLEVVCARNPDAEIWTLLPFCGVFRTEISETVEAFRAESGRLLHVVDTAGWVPLEPLHPDEANHKKAAEKLTAIIRQTAVGKHAAYLQ